MLTGQVSLERTKVTGLPGHDSGVRRAADKVVWAGQLEQDRWVRTGGSGQSGQYDSQDRTSESGQLRQDSRDRSDWTNWPVS
jgi:hypothetical protein